jgi:hypothetical protein
MDEIEFLEMELKLLQDSIARLKEFRKEVKKSGDKYYPCSSRIMGEVKHRSVALKQRLTIVCQLSTTDFLR